MNSWVIEHKHKLERLFIEVINFMYERNIRLRIENNELFNKFVNMAYKSSNKPFEKYLYTYYDVKKKIFNNNYDISLGTIFFDVLYNLKLELQEYDKLFLCRLHTHSLQNFFENYFDLEETILTKHIDYEQDNIHDNYIDY